MDKIRKIRLLRARNVSLICLNMLLAGVKLHKITMSISTAWDGGILISALMVSIPLIVLLVWEE